MAAKAILVLCALALIAQSVFSQCLNSAAIDATRFGAPFGLAGRDWAYDGLAYDGLSLAGRGWGCGCGPNVEYTATSGGGLPVVSSSPIPPVGVSVASENVYEGTLASAGEVPFVGTVGVEGVLPSAGAGAVNYGCGNGVTAMVSETIPSAAAFSPAIAPAASLAAPGIGAFGLAGIAAPALGLRSGWAGRGCGCGL